MKKLLFTGVLFLSVPLVLLSQNYSFQGVNPFGIEVVESLDDSNPGWNYQFFDADGDNDLDLIIFGISAIDTVSVNLFYNLRYFISYQENIGSSNSPEFASRQNLYDNFEFPVGGGFLLPTVGDLNNDGLFDVVVSAEVDIYGLQYLQFQIQNPDGSFSVSNCLDWDLPEFSSNSFFIPSLVDMDMDGDLDLMLSGYYGVVDENDQLTEDYTFLYAKNTGTADSPEFLGWYHNPFGLEPNGQSLLIGGDIDLDGDSDLLNLTLDGDLTNIAYVENMGGTGRPDFEAPAFNALGLQAGAESETFMSPDLVDKDADGDLDLFLPVLLDEDVEFRYYENDLCHPTIIPLDAAVCFGESYEYNDVSYSESGLYLLDSTGADGCKIITELNLTIADEINTQLVVDGERITAENNEDYSYTWIDCNTGEPINGANASTFIATYSGDFAVEITDQYGCSAISDCVDVVVSSVEESDLSSRIKVFPTLTSGRLFIRSQVIIDAIEVFNMSGEQVHIANRASQLDLFGMPPGIYFVKVHAHGESIVRKIVIAP